MSARSKMRGQAVMLRLVGADGRVLWERPFAEVPADIKDGIRQELLAEANFEWACEVFARLQADKESP